MLVEFRHVAAFVWLLSNTQTATALFHVHVSSSNRDDGRCSEGSRSRRSIAAKDFTQWGTIGVYKPTPMVAAYELMRR